MNKDSKKKWNNPSVKDLGKAKDLTKNINTVGGGDSEFSVLLPS